MGLSDSKKSRLSAYNIIFDIALIFVTFIIEINCNTIATLPIMGVYVIILSVLFCITMRHNIYTFIVAVMITWFNYSIIAANYFANTYNFFTTDAYTQVAVTGINVLIIFMATLIIFTNVQQQFDNSNKKIVFESSISGSPVMALIYIIMLLVVFIFGFTRSQGNYSVASSYYEYSIIVFIVGYFFMGKVKWYRYASTLLLLMYSLQVLFYGGRITALQELLIFFLLFVHKEISVNLKKLIPISLATILFFVGIGIFRASFSFSGNDLSVALKYISQNSFTLDTAYAAYHTSLTFIKTRNILEFADRIKIFFNWGLSLIVGGSVENSNLPLITRNYFMHYNGGILPFYGYFYFDYIGVVLCSMLVSVYINLLRKISVTEYGLVKCINVYIVAALPRWYIYSATPLTRGVMLLSIVYYITYYSYRFTSKHVVVK